MHLHLGVLGYRIFTELWVTEFHHHYINFSETTIIKIVIEETSHELYAWNFLYNNYHNLCTCVSHESEDVCPQGIILSQQGLIFRIPISNISALLTKRKFSPTISYQTAFMLNSWIIFFKAVKFASAVLSGLLLSYFFNPQPTFYCLIQ